MYFTYSMCSIYKMNSPGEKDHVVSNNQLERRNWSHDDYANEIRQYLYQYSFQVHTVAGFYTQRLDRCNSANFYIILCIKCTKFS